MPKADDDQQSVFRIRKIQEGVFDIEEKSTRRDDYFRNYEDYGSPPAKDEDAGKGVGSTGDSRSRDSDKVTPGGW